MSRLSRREWLLTVSATAAVPAAVRASALPRIPLGFSLYGMKSLALQEALKTCSACGYDGVELALMPGYHADPATLNAVARKSLRTQLVDSRLSLMGLMENVPAIGDAAAHRATLDRLKAAVSLANDLAPGSPPPIETILGGKPAEWDKLKETFATRLADWAAVAKDGKTVIAVKPHVGNALHSPDAAKWLIKQVNSPWIRLAFDQSHYELRGIKMSDAISELIPLTAFVHVKDAKGTAEKFQFLLPGEGTTNYRDYAKQLAEAKYAGPVVVEVSGQVSGKAGYDPAKAAESCFRSLSPAFGLKD